MHALLLILESTPEEQRLREEIVRLTAEIDDRIAAEKYVAAAYGVVFVFLLLWLVIHSARVARLATLASELAERQKQSSASG